MDHDHLPTAAPFAFLKRRPNAAGVASSRRPRAAWHAIGAWLTALVGAAAAGRRQRNSSTLGCGSAAFAVLRHQRAGDAACVDAYKCSRDACVSSAPRAFPVPAATLSPISPFDEHELGLSTVFAAGCLALVVGRGSREPRTVMRDMPHQIQKRARRFINQQIRLRQRPRRMTPYIPKGGIVGMQKPMEDPDNHIYEYIEIEDLADCEPKKLTGTVELGKWSEVVGCPPLKFCAPEYRRPRMPQSGKRGIEPVIPYDYDEEHNLSRDLLELVGEPEFMEVGTEAAERAVKEADIITSWEGLRCLVGFADNSLQTSMESWGLNYRKKREGREVDLFRIGRLRGYPQGPVVLGSIWQYDHNPNQRTTVAHLRRRREGWARICTGSDCSKYKPEDILHYRLLSYRLGDFKLVVRVNVRATVPLDDDSFERPSQGVFFAVAREIDESKIWNADLRARYAEMKFADAAMYARATYKRGGYRKCQELTTWDFALDRLDVPYEADIIFGRVERLLQIIVETANAPAIAHRPMWVQYWDRTLRVMSPKFFHEAENDKELRQLYESRVAKALPMPEPLRV